MNQRTTGLLRFGAVAVSIGMAGCGGSPPPEPATPPARPAATTPATRPPATNNDGRAEAEAARRELARKRAVLEEMVFFDYADSTIRGDARRVLDAKVTILRAEPNIRIQVGGHADERGTTEYNLALGSRRASAIRDYLTGFGLAANRFEITSYGESRPLVNGRSEGSWARNRRGEFVIRAGLADRD